MSRNPPYPIECHAIPIQDQGPHVPRRDCPCHPLVCQRTGKVLHNAWDAREGKERAGSLNQPGWMTVWNRKPEEPKPQQDRLWKHMAQEHNLHLTETEIQDIIAAVEGPE